MSVHSSTTREAEHLQRHQVFSTILLRALCTIAARGDRRVKKGNSSASDCSSLATPSPTNHSARLCFATPSFQRITALLLRILSDSSPLLHGNSRFTRASGVGSFNCCVYIHIIVMIVITMLTYYHYLCIMK